MREHPGQQGVIRDLEKFYQAATVVDAEDGLGDCAQAWDEKYPTNCQAVARQVARHRHAVQISTADS